MAALDDFISRYLDRPFAWGSDDCSLFLADWWIDQHGTDPARHLRGSYATEAEKSALVSKAGGLVALVASCAARVGARRTCAPVDGDFGVVSVDDRQFAGICAGSMWAIRTETGIVFTSGVKVVRAWSV